MEQKDLIKSYKTNNILDIEKIYNDFYSYVYTIVINMSKQYLNDEDIEEIISDTFLVLWENTKKLDDKKPIKPYIAGIAKNLTKEKMRKRKININIDDYENKIESIARIDFVIEEREKIGLINNIINQFKDTDKEIFELYYYHSMKIKQIALLFNTTEFNVKQRLYRIRKKIKKIIEKEEGGYRNEK